MFGYCNNMIAAFMLLKKIAVRHRYFIYNIGCGRQLFSNFAARINEKVHLQS